MLNIEPISACLLMTDLMDYHVLYCHNQDVVKRKRL